MAQSTHIISDREVAKPSTNIGQHTRALNLHRMTAIHLKHDSFYQLDMDLGDLHVGVSENDTIPYDQKARGYGDFLIRHVREMVILSETITSLGH